MSALNPFLMGAVTACSVLAALFFLRFWTRTRDRFFLLFATSFLIEALSRIVLVAMSPTDEREPAVYAIRLIAYAIILVAIVDKNRKRK